MSRNGADGWWTVISVDRYTGLLVVDTVTAVDHRAAFAAVCERYATSELTQDLIAAVPGSLNIFAPTLGGCFIPMRDYPGEVSRQIIPRDFPVGGPTDAETPDPRPAEAGDEGGLTCPGCGADAHIVERSECTDRVLYDRVGEEPDINGDWIVQILDTKSEWVDLISTEMVCAQQCGWWSNRVNVV